MLAGLEGRGDRAAGDDRAGRAIGLAVTGGPADILSRVGPTTTIPARGGPPSPAMGASSMIWPLDESVWAAHACAVAGRALDEAELDLYLAGRAEPAGCTD